MSVRTIAILSAFLGMTLPASANVFICQFDAPERSVVQEVLAFGVRDDGQNAVAFDEFINYINEAPVEATVIDSSSKKMTLVWSLQAKGGGQQWARLNYRLAYFKDTNRATIRVKPAGYPNHFDARGACQRSNLTIDQIRRAQR